MRAHKHSSTNEIVFAYKVRIYTSLMMPFFIICDSIYIIMLFGFVEYTLGRVNHFSEGQVSTFVAICFPSECCLVPGRHPNKYSHTCAYYIELYNQKHKIRRIYTRGRCIYIYISVVPHAYKYKHHTKFK